MSAVKVVVEGEEKLLSELWFHFQPQPRNSLEFKILIEDSIEDNDFRSWLESVPDGPIASESRRPMLEQLGIELHFWLQSQEVPKSTPTFVVNTIRTMERHPNCYIFGGTCSIFDNNQ